MHYLAGMIMISGRLTWDHFQRTYEEEGLQINFRVDSFGHNKGIKAIEYIKKVIQDNKIEWITADEKLWIVDLDKLKEFIPALSELLWFKKKAYVEPEFISEDEIIFEKKEYSAKVVLNITPDNLKKRLVQSSEIPIEIRESIEKFWIDYPEPDKVAFIIMEFGTTDVHNKIVSTIKAVLNKNNLIGLRADDKQYHDDLFFNVLTYIYGCGFGIAVYERIENEIFNPNIALEVGYMMGLKKQVCLLKERTLKVLHSDLVGKLYKSFDSFKPETTIPSEISKWLLDKEIIK